MWYLWETKDRKIRLFKERGKKYARKATVERNLSVGLRRPKGTQ